jgi:DNA-binding transcriptional regulator YiaG
MTITETKYEKCEKAFSFSVRIREWQGKRTNAEAAKAMSVPTKTYLNWRQARKMPTGAALKWVEGKLNGRKH